LAWPRPWTHTVSLPIQGKTKARRIADGQVAGTMAAMSQPYRPRWIQAKKSTDPERSIDKNLLHRPALPTLPRYRGRNPADQISLAVIS